MNYLVQRTLQLGTTLNEFHKFSIVEKAYTLADKYKNKFIDSFEYMDLYRVFKLFLDYKSVNYVAADYKISIEKAE